MNIKLVFGCSAAFVLTVLVIGISANRQEPLTEADKLANAALAEAPPLSHVKILQRTPSFEEVEFDDGTKCIIRVAQYAYTTASLSCSFK